MKTFLFLCMVVVAALANNVQLSQSQKEKVRQHSSECMKETGVKPELLAQVKKGQFSEDEDLKKFTLCFFKKTGILSEDGKLNIQVALAQLPAGVDKTVVSKVLEECKTKKGKDAADSAYEIFKCYYKSTPMHVTF